MIINVGDEEKGFLIGFAASVAAGILTLVIFQNYIATRAAQQAIQNYRDQFGIMTPEAPTQSVRSYYTYYE